MAFFLQVFTSGLGHGIEDVEHRLARFTDALADPERDNVTGIFRQLLFPVDVELGEYLLKALCDCGVADDLDALLYRGAEFVLVE